MVGYRYFKVPHFTPWHTLKLREGFVSTAMCGLKYNDLDDGRAKIRARIPKTDKPCRACAKHKGHH